MLVVIVIAGILTVLGVTRYAGNRERSYLSALQSDLRNLSIHQELYYHEHAAYAELESLLEFDATPGVAIDLTYADARGWAATATHRALPGVECGIFTGDEELAEFAGPATNSGAIVCIQEP